MGTVCVFPMTERTRKPLKIVTGPSMGHANSARPVLIIAHTHTDLTCGKCGTVLLHGTALVLRAHGLLIRCGECGSYNATD
jgi:ribosomal protein S27E